MKRDTKGTGARGLVGWGIAFALLALALSMAAPSLTAQHGPDLLAALGSSGVLVAGMVTIPWQPPLTRDDLDLLANPQQANQPEVVPWALYDTAAVANAAAGPFTFFTALNVDKTLCNMEGPGQLPDPQYFVVHYLAADFLQIPQVTAAATPNTALANVENLLKTCRATFEFNMSNKKYGPFPLTMCHATGGTTGFGYSEGAVAAGTSEAAVNNGVPGSGGFPFCGALIIPPKIGFDVTVRLGAAATVAIATYNLRLTLVGALYRRVL